ncbi:MAG: DUF2442 domain-containing protein [Fibromonadaceae bacterium]|jgi:hypothetical protein|nr:DUF2442 domain-containing protein [Fibromonadaceae bacterium]
MLQPKIKLVEPVEPFSLFLEYETNEKKLFDVSPYIKGSWYGELKDKNYFKNVRITNNGYGIEWVNGQDIAPHELYENSVPYKCPSPS